MFTHEIINDCDCWVNGDFRIVKQKNVELYNAYKVMSRDNDGNPVSLSSIQKVLLRTEKTQELDEIGNPKKDINGNPVMIDTPLMGAKEYATFEEAKAVCI